MSGPADVATLAARMEELADRSRRLPDARVRWLVDWVRREMCPKLPALGVPSTGTPVEWLPRRVVIFTEYADTKRYLEQQLKAAIGATDQGDDAYQSFYSAHAATAFLMDRIHAPPGQQMPPRERIFVPKFISGRSSAPPPS